MPSGIVHRENRAVYRMALADLRTPSENTQKRHDSAGLGGFLVSHRPTAVLSPAPPAPLLLPPAQSLTIWYRAQRTSSVWSR